MAMEGLSPRLRGAIIGDGHTYGTVATPLATLIADARVGPLARAVIIGHGYSHGAVVIGHGYSHGAVNTPMATLIADATGHGYSYGAVTTPLAILTADACLAPMDRA